MGRGVYKWVRVDFSSYLARSWHEWAKRSDAEGKAGREAKVKVSAKRMGLVSERRR